MKKLILATALAVFSTLSLAQSMPNTKIYEAEVPCGESQEIRSWIEDQGLRVAMTGRSQNPTMPAATLLVYMDNDGVYALISESQNGEFACITDAGKFRKAGTSL